MMKKQKQNTDAERLYFEFWDNEETDNEATKVANFEQAQKNPTVRAQQLKQDINEIDVDFSNNGDGKAVANHRKTNEFPRGKDKFSSIKRAEKKVREELDLKRL